jgi:hypothetical protein
VKTYYKDESESVFEFYQEELEENPFDFNIEHFIEDVHRCYGFEEACAVEYVQENGLWYDFGCDNRDFLPYVNAVREK